MKPQRSQNIASCLSCLLLFLLAFSWGSSQTAKAQYGIGQGISHAVKAATRAQRQQARRNRQNKQQKQQQKLAREQAKLQEKQMKLQAKLQEKQMKLQAKLQEKQMKLQAKNHPASSQPGGQAGYGGYPNR